MAYTALKPCCFAGQRFLIGDVIPDEMIHPGSAKNLIRMGRIAKQSESTSEATEEPKNTILMNVDEGTLELKPTTEGLQAVFDVLTSTVENAAGVVAEMTDNDALLLLHITDSRKSIKEAAEARAEALIQASELEEESEEVGEQ